MQVVFDDGERRQDLDLTRQHPHATVADLADALGEDPARGLVVAGRLAEPHLTLAEAGLHQGSVLSPPGTTPCHRGAVELSSGAELSLALTGGLVAGPRWPLREGRCRVGRQADNDVVIDHPTVSAHHCVLGVDASGKVDVADLDSHNGTWVDGKQVLDSQVLEVGATIRIGAAQLSVVPSEMGEDTGPVAIRPVAGAIPVNRPPRPPPPGPVEPVPVPSSPTPPVPNPLSLVALVAPLAFAAVMVAVLGRLVYALFALLSPVMALGTWLESRRRSRRTTRRQSRQLATELERFVEALRERRGAELCRLRATAPHPAELVGWATAPGVRLWERRPGDGDFLKLRAGDGDLPWRPPLEAGGRHHPPEADRALADSRLEGAPALVDLSTNGVVGVVGDRVAALAVARSLVCQAATQSGPADVAVAVVCEADRVPEWEWVKWLPHTAALSAPGHGRLLGGDPDSSQRLLQRILSPAPSAVTGRDRCIMMVLDAEDLTDGLGAAARAVLRGQASPVAGVVVAPSQHRLPAMCTTVVELIGPDGEARVSEPRNGRGPAPFLAAGVQEDIAREWAMALARFGDPDAATWGVGLPSSVRLASLLGFDAFDAEQVAARWRSQGPDALPPTPLGVALDDVVSLDLARHGHLLVTGGGRRSRSEVLRAALAGLASQAGPDHLTLFLVDGTGSRALEQCARLPHSVGLVDDAVVARQALTPLADALAERERSERARPRLVVAIHDLATLSDWGAECVEVLARLARSGPAAGIHVMAVTARASDPASQAIVSSPHQTVELSADDDDALAAAPARPGWGLCRQLGAEVTFTAAAVSVRASPCRRAVDVAPFSFTGNGPPIPPVEVGGGAGKDTELSLMVGSSQQAFRAEGLRSPDPLWPPARGDQSPPAAALPDLLGIRDVGAVDPRETWRPRPGPERLRVPIGVGPGGEPLHLDLKESAQGGMGPHGLVVGATGSGKSELLRTLVSGLAITHPPEDLSFVLVDFKGGATFAGLACLPHVAGMITNLESDLALVDRMHDALYGEQRRRQELLREGGDLASVHDYHRLRASGADLGPLPSLLVVVDEFAELLTSRPDFIELFVALGRVGRSLGMHLLLASQRLDEGRLRGLESHLSYRIALRTFSAMESRTVLGGPDAYHLSPEPGGGYLKVDSSGAQRFKAAFASGPYEDGATKRAAGSPPPSVLDVAVARLRPAAPAAHQVWLPPLERAVPLDRVLRLEDGQPGLAARGRPGPGDLAVPVGVVDRPKDQAQTPLVTDLSGTKGNLVIVGAPQTGKSVLLRSLVSAFLVTHAPTEAQFYCVDYGGGGLAALEEAPHVGAVATRLDPERVRRVVAEVESVVSSRERLFRAEEIDSAAALRGLRSSERFDPGALADVFLVVDNWPALAQAVEGLDASVTDLAARGLGYGVHVILTANRWMEVRTALRDSFGSRLELRLNDPAESAVDRKAAANVPTGVPGRGLTEDGLHFQAALPRLDGRATPQDLQVAEKDLVRRARTAWPGPGAPPVRLLPPLLAFTDLPGPGQDFEAGVPVGIAEADLTPVYLDLTDTDPHLLVFGDGESGKTTFLKTFLAGLTTRHPPERVSVLVVDYRRTLLEAVHPDHLLGYAGAAPAAADHVARLARLLATRMPGAELSAAELRDRSWWSGPELYVVVDDYELVATPSGNPLAPLVDLLPHGRDLGLHLVLTRRVAGASRAVFEPVLQRAKELGSPGLILSGDRQEGPLVGPYRASEQVPGRGLLVRRRRPPTVVQVAWVPA